MQLYDAVIREFHQILEPCRAHCTVRDVASDSFVWENLEGQLLLKSETAVELGGGSLPAVGGVLCACVRTAAGREAEAGLSAAGQEAGAVPSAAGRGTGAAFPAAGREAEAGRPAAAQGTDAMPPAVSGGRRVTLCGPDLPALKGDVPYARVTLVNVRDAFTAEEQKLYNLFRSIEYIRYRVSPRGYVPRISTSRNREQVRVSGEAVRAGLDFFKAGRVYGDACLKHPAVASAETFFITLDGFDYKALQDLFDRTERITTSLEHPLNRLNMDCTACSLKQVCDEAEACLKA